MKHDIRSRMRGSRHRRWKRALSAMIGLQVYFGRHLSRVPRGSLVFFPYLPTDCPAD